MRKPFVAASFAALLLMAPQAYSATFNLEFDTDGDFSTIEGTGVMTVDDSLFSGAAFEVLSVSPLVSFDIDLAGQSYETAWDNSSPEDTFLAFDSAGNFVGTDDRTGMFTDVQDLTTTSGSIVSHFAFADDDFGSFVIYDADVVLEEVVSVTGGGQWRVAVVPVPAAGWLLLAGLGTFVALRRRGS